ncbi:MAG: hypothetical protein HY606_04320, partial [Planctomycetes bacterium]|nr:hypothetical protein [Planctomycetota bacterium]
MCKNRHWIQDTISHQQTEAVPYNFMFSPLSRQSIETYYGGVCIEEIMDFPIRMSSPKSIKPLYATPAEFGKSVKDEFGVVWSTSNIDRGSPIGYCLVEPDLSGYEFPDPSAAYRFEDLGKWCENNRENYTIIWVGDLWERATFMRGMENLLLDLVLNPKFIKELLRNITDYILQTMEILCDNFSFDGIALSDDYGTQKSMLMSPSDWRKFIRPLLKE